MKRFVLLKTLYQQELIPEKVYIERLHRLLDEVLRNAKETLSDQVIDLASHPIAQEILPKPSLAQCKIASHLAINVLEKDPLTNSDGPEMVLIPPGAFQMGALDNEYGADKAEYPRHKRVIRQPFYVSTTPISVALYLDYCAESKTEKPKQLKPNPMVNISWQAAVNYCQWLSDVSKKRYRLPSEAEWEYFTRAGSDTAFNFGTKVEYSQANFDGRYPYNDAEKSQYYGEIMPIKSYPQNDWGLFETHGNVWEWVHDCWHENYEQAPKTASPWLESDSPGKVVRGGSWQQAAQVMRSAARAWNYAEFGYDDVGFRVLREI